MLKTFSHKSIMIIFHFEAPKEDKFCLFQYSFGLAPHSLGRFSFSSELRVYLYSIFDKILLKGHQIN